MAKAFRLGVRFYGSYFSVIGLGLMLGLRGSD